MRLVDFCTKSVVAAALSSILCMLVVLPVPAAEDTPSAIRIVFKAEGGREQTVTGMPLVEDQQGGVLIEDSAGILWTIPAEQLVRRETLPGPLRVLNTDELEASLREAAGGESQTLTTKHYLIVSRAGKAYSQWCGILFERLRTGFLGYWERAGLPLHPGDAPLPVLILASQEQFAEYARRDGAAVVIGASGYYSARTNRVVLFDLTADAGTGRPLGDAASRQEISLRLEGTQSSIATVVHEAVHQLAFNSGLQTRYADNPMWISEGLAMYFETPDLNHASGWKAIGRINPGRLAQFRQSLATRKDDSLQLLIQNEDRFRDPDQAVAAYAESWALVHFLASQRREALVSYLKRLGEKPRLEFAEPPERISEFEEAFGELADVDAALRKHAARQRNSR